MKISIFLIPALTAVMLSACGGSGGSSDSTGTGSEPAATGGVLTGRFVDSAVVGLQYATATHSGVTDTNGSFSYEQGEDITFSIGDISLPTVPAASLVTPLSVFSTEDITDTRVMNLAQLLQTLDTDNDPDNGITLADAAISSAAGLSVDFASPSFSDQVVNLVANSGSVNSALVNPIEALDHLQETLFAEGVNERPAAPAPVEEQMPTPGQNTSDHPLVGTSAEFSNFAHDIGGTLTVLDDRTLQVTNFSYDGGGVVVYFYTGTDGDFSNGQQIGPLLNGRPYDNETLILTIPDNLTLDDFNALSVWCVPFAVSFGDAQL